MVVAKEIVASPMSAGHRQRVSGRRGLVRGGADPSEWYRARPRVHPSNPTIARAVIAKTSERAPARARSKAASYCAKMA